MNTQSGQVRDLVEALVSIDSVNPALVLGGAGEAKVAAYIADWLQKAGASVELDEPRPGRVSVIARVPGTGGGRSLLLNGHIDTVGVAGMKNAHTPRVEGDKLFGRGSYDMKSGVAAAMLTLASAVHLRLRGDVILTAVCDEEHASIGTEAALKRVSADAAIVVEPTALDIVIAHKGFAWFTVETSGVAAHGSRPDLGVDAIVAMGKVLNGLDRLNQILAQGARHSLLGPASIHASLISGGQELSSYPENCKLSVERRTIPGESLSKIQDEIKSILDQELKLNPKFKGTFTTGLVREPLEVAETEPVVTTLRKAAVIQLRREPRFQGFSGWTDAGLITAAGIPTVIFGSGGAGAHAIDEWCNLGEVLTCHEVLVATAAAFCA
ncbi:MAG TPA: ArgE/DapE family deacylase [Candidatus Polarisedimenticolia bacterium]|nr:ArgE/DapE family deacylase [Candidatus Polarisedimenticolia bacterium]